MTQISIWYGGFSYFRIQNPSDTLRWDGEKVCAELLEAARYSRCSFICGTLYNNWLNYHLIKISITFSTTYCITKSQGDFIPTSLWCPSTFRTWAIGHTLLESKGGMFVVFIWILAYLTHQVALGLLQWEVPPNPTRIWITLWILGWSWGLLFSFSEIYRFELSFIKQLIYIWTRNHISSKEQDILDHHIIKCSS